MRESGRSLVKVFEQIRPLVKPGVTTAELDRTAEACIAELGAKPAFKGYRGYPATICASVNETVVHGIPSKQKLKEGDIVSIDMGLVLDGYFADAARTWPVGEVDEESRELIRVARRSFEAGLERFKANGRLGDISHAVQEFAERLGFSVVRDYVGHGIGQAMHEDPQVPNYGEPGRGVRLEHGLVLAIEPMINAGGPEVDLLDDRWTVVTRDGERSAHFENTVALTEAGPEVLTPGWED